MSQARAKRGPSDVSGAPPDALWALRGCREARSESQDEPRGPYKGPRDALSEPSEGQEGPKRRLRSSARRPLGSPGAPRDTFGTNFRINIDHAKDERRQKGEKTENERFVREWRRKKSPRGFSCDVFSTFFDTSAAECPVSEAKTRQQQKNHRGRKRF